VFRVTHFSFSFSFLLGHDTLVAAKAWHGYVNMGHMTFETSLKIFHAQDLTRVTLHIALYITLYIRD
jgi:hypothetical protein